GWNPRRSVFVPLADCTPRITVGIASKSLRGEWGEWYNSPRYGESHQFLSTLLTDGRRAASGSQDSPFGELRTRARITGTGAGHEVHGYRDDEDAGDRGEDHGSGSRRAHGGLHASGRRSGVHGVGTEEPWSLLRAVGEGGT